MSWRNTWHLYKKQDAKTGQEIFSVFPSDSPVKIYERDYWASDAWDPLEYGRDIDWSRPFLSQVAELLQEVPLPAHSAQSVVNSEYCTNASYIKNCYFSRALAHTEDCAYVIWDESSKQCMDSHMTDHCELGYGNVNCTRCYKAFFSVNCEDCRDVTFSKDCVGCSDCLGCVGLRSKSYCIFNIPYTKEEYVTKLGTLDLGSKKAFEECRERAVELWSKFPVKFMQGLQNTRVSGDYIYNSKNAKYCWRVKGVEDSKYCLNMLSGPVKDCYDYANWGGGSELIYEGLVCGDQTSNIKFSWNCFGGAKNIEYSIFCHGAADVFGCVSIRRKQYCILNKQYSKEEYEKLVPKIIEHMKTMPYRDRKGREYCYGEFFPSELSPFPFNISEAYELSPKTKEEAIAEGLEWREEAKREYVATKQPDKLPDRIKDASEEILQEVIACDHKRICQEECTGAFRIIERELEFLKRFNIPLPNLCPNCRHYSRLALRNIPKFFKRACHCAGEKSENGVYMNTGAHPSHAKGEHCSNEFETSYAPERPEIVYCEQCYQSEVA
ncbi:MAG: hypothetical protein A2946_01375 [Candidatus Liptonbacteria bacterium RIFCSPLOWO2_01_FULL_53_13]|uniref:Caib/baif family protein n=1 Tax=Candidatus Liptonbacteria bacterium RIFCSPLOWO2_01_FULL_53_13 TaxID=1798651 RepID=A0A1G2CJV6_9BACT|nr:MAG: hypothetical protein A2946_01375 [Candidatus Liptonbacteria bacterium RIFCSPLOWO2_01_FULL_53_13]